MRWVVALAWLAAALSAWTFTRTTSLELRLAPAPRMASDGAPHGAPIRSTPEPDSMPPGPALLGAGDELAFERLAFDDYDPPGLRTNADPLGPADFPAAARALDGQRVTLVGFSQALQVSDGAAQALLVARFPPGCCFGTVPVFDEWVRVEPAEPVELVELPSLVRATGTLVVGESLVESGEVECLYRLTGATLAEY